jgi:hypothetical protein
MAKNTPKKQEEKTEPPKDTTIKVPPDLKTALDEIKGEGTYAEAIQKLLIQKAAIDIPDEGMIPLRMTGKSYRTLLMAVGSTPALSDILWKARVV